MDKLENILESILFLSGNAVEIKEVALKLEVLPKEIINACKILKEKYSGSSGIHILLFNNKIQLSSNPDYAQMVETVLNPIKERELSKAMMEVSSIIAYKQPVTRLEIEEIRGVNSDYAIMMLSKHNIVEVVGRKDAIGKPLLYGTTDNFLKRFQLSSLNDLPDYEEIVDRIKVLHPEASKDLYYKGEFKEESSAEKDEISNTVIENSIAQIKNGENLSDIKSFEDIISVNLTENELLLNKNNIKENIKLIDNLENVYNENNANNKEYIEELPDFLKEEKDIKIFR